MKHSAQGFIFKIKRQGFTLIEILVVVALIAMTVLGVLINGRQAGQTEGLRTSVSVFSDTLQEARVSSQNVRNQSAWGVIYVSQTSYQIVYGRASAFTASRVIDLEKGSSFTSPFEVWFEKGTGQTASQIITIQNQQGNSYTVSINELGVLEIKMVTV